MYKIAVSVCSFQKNIYSTFKRLIRRSIIKNNIKNVYCALKIQTKDFSAIESIANLQTYLYMCDYCYLQLAGLRTSPLIPSKLSTPPLNSLGVEFNKSILLTLIDFLNNIPHLLLFYLAENFCRSSKFVRELMNKIYYLCQEIFIYMLFFYICISCFLII